jgi:hypothetical protein
VVVTPPLEGVRVEPKSREVATDLEKIFPLSVERRVVSFLHFRDGSVTGDESQQLQDLRHSRVVQPEAIEIPALQLELNLDAGVPALGDPHAFHCQVQQVRGDKVKGRRFRELYSFDPAGQQFMVQ